VPGTCGTPISQGNKDSAVSLTDAKSLSSSYLGAHLAGLIEGQGNIAVHDKDSNSKIYRPKIIIAFNINDKPLAEKLSITNFGERRSFKDN
jgi:prophage tail gpP-like protein